VLARGVDLRVLAYSPANHILRFGGAHSETGYAKSDGSVNGALHHKRKRSGRSAARILGRRRCHCDSPRETKWRANVGEPRICAKDALVPAGTATSFSFAGTACRSCAAARRLRGLKTGRGPCAGAQDSGGHHCLVSATRRSPAGDSDIVVVS
jgi:hypothetical protein